MSLWLNLIPQLHRPGEGDDISMRHHHFQEEGDEYYDGNNNNLIYRVFLSGLVNFFTLFVYCIAFTIVLKDVETNVPLPHFSLFF